MPVEGRGEGPAAQGPDLEPFPLGETVTPMPAELPHGELGLLFAPPCTNHFAQPQSFVSAKKRPEALGQC